MLELVQEKHTEMSDIWIDFFYFTIEMEYSPWKFHTKCRYVQDYTISDF